MIQDLHQRATGGSSLLDLIEISEHLKELNYPKSALDGFLHCGEGTSIFLKGECDCNKYSIRVSKRCNKRFCPKCAPRRKKRIKRRLRLYLRDHFNNRQYSFKFLTIAPKNYDNLDEGMKHIKKSFRKFYRRKYIKERLIGGFYVLECTNKGNGWNIHLHCIVYSKRLDNVYRGKCSHCGQSYLKRDRNSGKFYCANRKCNQIYEGVIKKPKIAELFESSSKRSCFSDISHIGNKKSVINYCLKYIVSDKSSFQDSFQFSQFIVSSYNQRLISPFGDFSSLPKIKSVVICPSCDTIIRFTLDIGVMKDVLSLLASGEVGRDRGERLSLESYLEH